MAGNIETIIEKLPYSDGSLRRRLVSGGIVLVGIIICAWVYIPKSLDTLKFAQGITPLELIRSPIIVGIALLFVYASGNLAELLGEIFLARAASGIFWILSCPLNIGHSRHAVIKWIIRCGLYLTLVPSLMPFTLFIGFTGYTPYRINIRKFLSQKAIAIYEQFPTKVKLGLTHPVGDETETAWKYLLDLYPKDKDRAWAKQHVSRVRDVLAITTALIIFILGIETAITLNVMTKEPQIKLLSYEVEREYIQNIKNLNYKLNRQDDNYVEKINHGDEDRIFELDRQEDRPFSVMEIIRQNIQGITERRTKIERNTNELTRQISDSILRSKRLIGRSRIDAMIPLQEIYEEIPPIVGTGDEKLMIELNNLTDRITDELYAILMGVNEDSPIIISDAEVMRRETEVKEVQKEVDDIWQSLKKIDNSNYYFLKEGYDLLLSFFHKVEGEAIEKIGTFNKQWKALERSTYWLYALPAVTIPILLLAYTAFFKTYRIVTVSLLEILSLLESNKVHKFAKEPINLDSNDKIK